MQRTIGADAIASGTTAIEGRRSRGTPVTVRLSIVIAGLMASQAAVGLLVPSVYRDTGWVTAAWYGNDLVTLFVAVPLLAWSLHAANRGSLRGELLWYAMLGYAVYNYAYYLFGAELNWFFPVYAALFALPVFALVLALGRVNAEQVADRFAPTTPRRWIGAYMLFTGIGLSLAWTAQWANFMLTGAEPNIGVDGFQLVAAMDLTFMVPLFIVGAILLFRRAPWGYIVSAIVIVKGATYTLVLTTTSAVAATRGVEGTLEQIPIWAAWTLLGLLAAWGLLGSIRPPVASDRWGR